MVRKELVGGNFQKEPQDFESCAVTVPALRKVARPWQGRATWLSTGSVQTWTGHPASHATPRQGSRRGQGQPHHATSGITEGTENRRDHPEACPLLKALGLPPLKQVQELGEK